MKSVWQEFKEEVKADWLTWSIVGLLAVICALIDLLLVTHWLR